VFGTSAELLILARSRPGRKGLRDLIARLAGQELHRDGCHSPGARQARCAAFVGGDWDAGSI
jgi:hypothetical protein